MPTLCRGPRPSSFTTLICSGALSLLTACGGATSEASGSGSTRYVPPTAPRATANACSRDRSAIVSPADAGPAPAQGCVSDADCNAGINGRCERLHVGLVFPSSACTYDDCFTDADCTGAFAACICGEPLQGVNPASSRGPNTCVTGNCRIDADCGPDGYCSLSVDSGYCSAVSTPTGLYCHTAKDDCAIDSDCTEPGTGCTYSTALGKWACTAQGGCSG